jgi:hypothetical protein
MVNVTAITLCCHWKCWHIHFSQIFLSPSAQFFFYLKPYFGLQSCSWIYFKDRSVTWIQFFLSHLFYASSRKTDGTQFKKTALQSIHYGVKKHIVETMDLDISDKTRFLNSNRYEEERCSWSPYPTAIVPFLLRLQRRTCRWTPCLLSGESREVTIIGNTWGSRGNTEHNLRRPLFKAFAMVLKNTLLRRWTLTFLIKQDFQTVTKCMKQC